MIDDELKAAKELILWARSQRVALSVVRVGAVELAIVSMIDNAPLPTEAEAKQGLYARYGGDVLAKAAEVDKGETVYDEED